MREGNTVIIQRDSLFKTLVCTPRLYYSLVACHTLLKIMILVLLNGVVILSFLVARVSKVDLWVRFRDGTVMVQYSFCHLDNRKFTRALAETCRFEAPTEISNFSVTAMHTREKGNDENMVILLKKKMSTIVLSAFTWK